MVSIFLTYLSKYKFMIKGTCHLAGGAICFWRLQFVDQEKPSILKKRCIGNVRALGFNVFLLHVFQLLVLLLFFVFIFNLSMRVRTCSAASLLMARASCSCSSSSPLVWGLACSSSEPALGDVAKTHIEKSASLLHWPHHIAVYVL